MTRSQISILLEDRLVALKRYERKRTHGHRVLFERADRAYREAECGISVEEADRAEAIARKRLRDDRTPLGCRCSACAEDEARGAA
jgi:hypothetical protein